MLQDVDLKYSAGVLTTGARMSAATPQAGTDLTTKAYVDGVTGTAPAAVLPSDVGMKAWAYDPVSMLGAGNTITDGTIYLNSVYVRTATSVTGLCFYVIAAGTSMTAGQNWIGLYNSAGTKLVDASLDAVFTTAGGKQVSVSSQNLTAGQYWVALLSNGTGTDPQGGVCNTTGGNQGLTAQGLSSGATLRFAVNGTGATSLPSSITPASNTTTGAKPYWVGLS